MKKQIHPFDTYVGSRIRLCRSLLDMSQQTLARSLGITFQQIQKYERGTNRVSASRLYEIAETLGTHPAWFFEGFETCTSPDAHPTHEHDVTALTHAFSGIMDKTNRERIINITRLFIETSDSRKGIP